MRIWDLPPSILCRQHLLGEHRELHAIWTVLTQKRAGYSHHPETMRWKGRLAALFRRHEQQVREMMHRGYKHQSPLSRRLAVGSKRQTDYVHTPLEQKRILQKKHCRCETGVRTVEKVQ